jgi:hypothetical protein
MSMTTLVSIWFSSAKGIFYDVASIKILCSEINYRRSAKQRGKIKLEKLKVFYNIKL